MVPRGLVDLSLRFLDGLLQILHLSQKGINLLLQFQLALAKSAASGPRTQNCSKVERLAASCITCSASPSLVVGDEVLAGIRT